MNELQKQYLAIKGEIKWYLSSQGVYIAAPVAAMATAYLWMWV